MTALHKSFVSHFIDEKLGLPSGSVVKNPPANAGGTGDTGFIPCWEDVLEEGMATHSSTLARRTPWTEEPGRLQCIGSQRIGHY